MDILTYFPGPLLSPFVKCYVVIETAAETINRVLPDTSAVMAFRWRGKVRIGANRVDPLAPMVLSGLRKTGRDIHYEAGTSNLLVIFKEGGITPFLREPLHLLSDTSVGLDCLDGFCDTSLLEERLGEVSTHEERIQVIERFLTELIRDPGTDQLILTAIEKIRHTNGQIRIRELADSLYISQDAFEKRFRRIAGLSPKKFAGLIKMRSLVAQGLSGTSLTQIALDAGYFDQPHFNRDFKLFTGQAPSAFLKSPVFW
nr:helix-turn-helix transcriptional regulator [uncultured Dyadobacter sp.]